MNNDQGLERIDAKLAALLAISVDRYLRETGIARPKPRSIDRMLSDVGLNASDIASLLGKTERAVYKVLQEEQRQAESKRTSRKPKGHGSKRTGTPPQIPEEAAS
jgi:hypothetical protein